MKRRSEGSAARETQMLLVNGIHNRPPVVYFTFDVCTAIAVDIAVHSYAGNIVISLVISTHPFSVLVYQ